MTQSKSPVSNIGQNKHTAPAGSRLKNSPKGPLLLLILPAIIFLLLSCGKDPEADVTTELAASFADSPAKEDIIQAKTAFEEGRYKESLQLLYKVVSSGGLTERQRKAMAGIVGRVLQAVHEDPQLSNDKQLHRMMQLLVVRIMGET